MQVHDLLLHAERTSAARTAVVDGPTRRNYAETAARVRAAAAGLLALGLRNGDRVAIAARNRAHFLEAYFAVSLAGLIAVPLNIRLSELEITRLLEDCEPSAVLCEPDLAKAFAPGLDVPRLALEGSGDGTWESLIERHAETSMPPVSANEDACAHLFYTGGTTGRPKGAMLSHRNVIASATNKIVLGQFARDDVWLHAAPMFHQADAWAVLSFTALGATHVFLPAFRAEEALRLVQAHGVTGSQMVPTMIFMLLDEARKGRWNLSSVRRILYGSAPMPTAMLSAARQAFGDVFQHIYGLTEAAGTVAATPWPAAASELEGERLASCGQPIAGVSMRIADESGLALPPDVIGRIQVRGANVMTGYWRLVQETQAAFVDGWLDTGDLGRMDEDGFVYIVDRAKDTIISGGENVYSTEVEEALFAHPGIAEAAVIGIPDLKWGEIVTAVVVPRADTELVRSSIAAHCRDRLAGYKVPKAIHIVDALPRSAAGKVLKHELRAQYSG